MKSCPLISVLVPAYNHEKYIAECLSSILIQDWSRMELLVVDDGSTDGTWDVLQSMKEKCGQRCERVVMERRDNGGICSSLNRLCELANGEFVAIVASDDAYLPGAFTAMMRPLMTDPTVGFVTGQNQFMDGDGRRCYWDRSLNNVYSEPEAAYRTWNEYLTALTGIEENGPEYGSYERLVACNHIVNGYIIRRSVLNRVLPYRSEAPVEDHWLHMQLSKITRYRSVPEETFRYRWHAANTAKQKERMLAMAYRTLKWEEGNVAGLPDPKWREAFRRATQSDERLFDAGWVCRLTVRRSLEERRKILTVFGRDIVLRRKSLTGNLSARILIVAHVYYPELWDELAACIRNISEAHDLFVTYIDDRAVDQARRDFPEATFVKCDNRGYDIWPFLAVLKSVDLSEYSHVVKLHTKRNIEKRNHRPFNGELLEGSAWRDVLLAFVKTPEAWRRSLAAFDDLSVGMVADRRLIVGRNGCTGRATRKVFDAAVRTVRELTGRKVRRGCFVPGSMFVARAELFSPLRGWNVDEMAFADSVSDGKSELAHVVERMLGLCVAAADKRIVPVNPRRFDRMRKLIKRMWFGLCDFVWQRKITSSDRLITKVFKIPVRNRPVHPHSYFLSLGYNCELAFRYLRKHRFCDSGMLQWSYCNSIDQLIHALRHLDQFFTGEVKDPCPLYQCGNTLIYEHGKLDMRKVMNGVSPEDRQLVDQDKADLIGRMAHLRQRFVKQIGPGTLVAYKMRTSEYMTKDAEFKLHELLAALLELGRPGFDFLLVLEDACKAKRISLAYSRGFVRYVRTFNPDGNVPNTKIGDGAGWNRIFGEFIPRLSKRKNKRYKFE